jgi:hypothetical protein
MVDVQRREAPEQARTNEEVEQRFRSISDKLRDSAKVYRRFQVPECTEYADVLEEAAGIVRRYGAAMHAEYQNPTLRMKEIQHEAE